jgi:hypothetical protein
MTYEGAPPEGRENRVRWRTDEGGPALPAWIAIGVAIAVVVLGFGAWWTFGLGRGMPMDGAGMGGGMGEMDDAPQIPPVHGYYAGDEILFFHTEASDQQVADILTGMMGSPVLVVPRLADVPDSALATVYVFANGVQPDGPRGPFGFQPDVFDSAPGDAAYTPLRALTLVSWRDKAAAEVLRSAEEVEAAIDDGRLTVERPRVVVNMPFLNWPGGER